MDLIAIAEELVRGLAPLRFRTPVTHVYNPLDYAAAPYGQYIGRFGCTRRDVVLVGMNPGPWGMAQTGVPFGEVAAVRDWMGINAPVGRPTREHPKRPVEGLNCRRSEVSGARLWAWARSVAGTPEAFFRQFFVTNYCPLLFLTASGANITPDKLTSPQQTRLFAVCDQVLRRTVECMQPRYVVGIGGFAEARARHALAGMDVSIGRILHPSPASPAANRDWAGQVTAQLQELGIDASALCSRPIRYAAAGKRSNARLRRVTA
jgi:single-strand selective monofunctional uracil DNA glycosylase